MQAATTGAFSDTVDSMRVAMMTREYPPEVYGGAGVHVTELVAQLRHLCEVDVHCMGAPRAAPSCTARPALQGANPALSTLSADLMMANAAGQATVVHSHTWYAGLAGHLAALLYGIPHVLTAHSLEPMRPWKAEQLGGGYRVSSWVEQHRGGGGRRRDRGQLGHARRRVAHLSRRWTRTGCMWCATGSTPMSGIRREPRRPANRCSPNSASTRLGPSWRSSGGSPGRRASPHLVAAAHQFAPDIQLVLCAGAPDTPEIAEEVTEAVQELARARTGVFWIREMLPIGKIREILSAATVFVCPSVYEPLGIVNLEAMACATAVVASDVGGIPEVVADGVTGVAGALRRERPVGVSRRGWPRRSTQLVADPDKARQYGHAGRQRCIEEFSWAHIAEQTLEIYRKVSRSCRHLRQPTPS